MSAAAESQGQATYVVAKDDHPWLLNVQRKLYALSRENPDYMFEKLWGLVTDPRNLRIAFARVNRNRGRRTGGIDRVTVGQVLNSGVDAFLQQIRQELRTGRYRPSPVRRVLIPKAGKPGKHRPLGIPTVKDRVIQAATKNILEPIFEADFYPISYGFRPGKSVHGSEAQFLRAQSGTPQGGILSPLLANIALSAIDGRYARHVWPRGVSEPDGTAVTGEIAAQEKTALAGMLECELGLKLSEEKTLVTPVTQTMAFLGHHLRVRPHPSTGRLVPHAVIPKDRSKRLRVAIKRIFSVRTTGSPLSERLQLLTPVLRGWANFYRHA